MKKIILIILFMLPFLYQNASAQNNFSTSLGGGYLYSTGGQRKLPYWQNGYLFNFTADYSIVNEFSLFFSSSYQKHFFDANLVYIPIPTLVGYRYSISGENSFSIELSIGGKVFLTNSIIRPYLGIGVGMLFINQGKIEITNWMDGNPNKSTSLLYNTGKNYNVGQINFSMGLEIRLINDLELVLDGKIINSFSGPAVFPVTTAVKLDF